MTLDLSAYDAMLKEYYTGDKVRELAYGKNVLLGILNKEMAGGDYYVQPIDHGRPGGASAGFSTSQTNYVASKYKAFQISRVMQYMTPKVATEVIIATRDKASAFAPAFREFDRAFRSLSTKLNLRLYRTSTGKIGRLASTVNVATDTAALTDPADCWNFEEGDVITLDDADGGGAVKAGTITVESVDHKAGTVTFTGNISAGIATAAASDYAFQQGDYDLCSSGLEDWLPVDDRSTKLAAAFHGVTRSVAPERLGGVYLDATSAGFGDLAEVITQLVGETAARGGTPTHVVVNHRRFIQLQLLWMSKTYQFQNIAVDVKETVDGRTMVFSTAFPGMRAMIGGYMVDVLADRTCPTNRVYCLEKDTWTLYYSGSKLPCFPNEEVGASILNPSSTADSYEGRVAAYHNLGCSAPGHNGVAKLSTLAA